MSVKCAVCGMVEFKNDNTLAGCEVCGWFNDGVQLDDPDFRGGCNEMSLNEYKALWNKYKVNPKKIKE